MFQLIAREGTIQILVLIPFPLFDYLGLAALLTAGRSRVQPGAHCVCHSHLFGRLFASEGLGNGFTNMR
jgi:hypothetical protein